MALVKPHQALDPYISLATITALKILFAVHYEINDDDDDDACQRSIQLSK